MSDTSTQAVLAVAQAQQAAHTPHMPDTMPTADRKSTRLNSSHAL